MTPTLVVHIGAHKTATTHLQRSILQSREALTQSGVRMFGPQQLRGANPTVLQRFDLPGSKKKMGDPQASYRDMLGNGHRLVISEENAIGSLLNRYGKMAEPLYPDAEIRLADLANKVAPQGLDICLGVRQPTSFLNSAFGQHLMSGGSLPQKKFVWKNPPRIVDWANLVSRLVALPQIRSLTVWRYEDYHQVFDQITAAMLGAKAAGLVRAIDGLVHQGISQEAAAQIERMHAEGANGPFWDTVKSAYPVGPNSPRFNAYGQIEHAASRVGYGLQMRKVASMNKVTLLQPRA